VSINQEAMSEPKGTETLAGTTKSASAPAPPASGGDPSTCSPEELLQATLFRMTSGLPRRELNLMVTEADECEASLMKEIEMLEKALKTDDNPLSTEDAAAMDDLLQSSLTPLDRYWTVSSLLGRLRDEWMLPSILVAMDGKKDEDLVLAPRPCPAALQAAKVFKTPHYTQRHETTTTLLAVWKRIVMHRTSLVFKRPVKPEEAPGYTERIVFPMDLSMVRKLIVARQVCSYAELHQYIGLISHNCVKYNGRESDYGRVAREFEAAAEELIRQAVVQQAAVAPHVAAQPAPQVKTATKSSSATTTTTATAATTTKEAIPAAAPGS
jgi:hypothetical protein